MRNFLDILVGLSTFMAAVAAICSGYSTCKAYNLSKNLAKNQVYLVYFNKILEDLIELDSLLKNIGESCFSTSGLPIYEEKLIQLKKDIRKVKFKFVNSRNLLLIPRYSSVSATDDEDGELPVLNETINKAIKELEDTLDKLWC